jgi:hypothetical protein
MILRLPGRSQIVEGILMVPDFFASHIPAVSGAIVAAGALGGALEPWAPPTQFPERWMARGLKPIDNFEWQNRLVTGMLFGMIFLARFCDFATCDLITQTAVPTVNVATLVMALLSGLVGARMVRMQISVPFLAAWDALVTVIDANRAKRVAAEKTVKRKGRKGKRAGGRSKSAPVGSSIGG